MAEIIALGNPMPLSIGEYNNKRIFIITGVIGNTCKRMA
jgi:hypothetical protein